MGLLLQLKGRIILSASVLLFPLLSGAQTQLQELYASRAQLLEAGSSTTSVDQQLYALNERFPARVVVQATGNGNTIVFPFFLDIALERKDRIIQRLSAYYSWIISMNIDDATRLVTVAVQSGDLQEQVNELVSHFGYIGHEIAD